MPRSQTGDADSDIDARFSLPPRARSTVLKSSLNGSQHSVGEQNQPLAQEGIPSEEILYQHAHHKRNTLSRLSTALGMTQDHRDPDPLKNYNGQLQDSEVYVGDPLDAHLQHIKQEETTTAEHNLSDALLHSYGLSREALEEKNVEENHKKQFQSALEKHTRNDKKFHVFCLHLSHNKYFQLFFACLIALNAIFMAFEADYNVRNDGDWEETQGGPVIANLFTLFFVLEAIVRFNGRVVPLWKDKILCFDLLIVWIAVTDNWVLNPLAYASNLYFLSTLRVFRLLRITRLLRLVRFLRPLRVLTACVVHAALCLFWIFVLLFFVIFAFSVVITILVGDDIEVDPKRHFRSVGNSMLTLLQVVLHGIEWGPEVYVPLTQGNAAAVVAGSFFLAYVIFGILCLSNLITGVFVEQMFDAAKSDDAHQHAEALLRQDSSLRIFRSILFELDTSNDGLLTWDEFRKGFETHPAFFDDLEVTMETAEALYYQLDVYKNDHVSIDDFLFAVIKFKEASKTIDMLSVDYQQQKALREIYCLAQQCDSDVGQIEECTRSIDSSLVKLSQDINALRSEVRQILGLERRETDFAAEIEDDSKLQAMKEEAASRAKELEEDYAFKGRLDRLEQNLAQLTRPTNALDALPKVDMSDWHMLLDKELRPWLQNEINKLRITKQTATSLQNKYAHMQAQRTAIGQVRGESSVQPTSKDEFPLGGSLQPVDHFPSGAKISDVKRNVIGPPAITLQSEAMSRI